MRRPLAEINANRAPGAELSHDARVLIVDCKQRGNSYRALEREFKCNKSTIGDTMNRFERTGEVDPKGKRSRP